MTLRSWGETVQILSSWQPRWLPLGSSWSGGASPPFMSDTARTIAEVIPNARLLVLEGQARCAAEALAPRGRGGAGGEAAE